jgi:glycosyltransferase involved in cell wall biosynthesis
VRCLGHIDDRKALFDLYDRASLFVLPSLFEPFGLAFLEAMGRGLACIGSNHCAMPEIIDQNQTGVLVPPGESGPLSEALIELLSNPARAAEMGYRAHQRVLNYYTWEHVAARMAPYIEKAASGAAAPGGPVRGAADPRGPHITVAS